METYSTYTVLELAQLIQIFCTAIHQMLIHTAKNKQITPTKALATVVLQMATSTGPGQSWYELV